MANLLFFLVVAGLYVACFFRPGTAVGLVLATYALEQCAQAFVPVAGYNDTLCNYLMAAAVLIAVLAQLLRHGPAILDVRASAWMTFFLLAYCYATVAWSLFPSTTENILKAQLPYLFTFVVLTPFAVQGLADLSDALTALLGFGTLSLLALLIFGEWQDRSVLLPYAGWRSNPLALAQVAGSLLVAATISPQLRALFGPIRWLGVSFIGATVLFTFLRTGSRGQVVAALATTLLFSVRRRGGLGIVLTLLAVGGLIASGFLAEEVSRNASRWDQENVSQAVSEGRVDQATLLLEYWSSSDIEHILLGLGHGTSQDPRLLGAYPHVVPAEVLGEEGLAGASLYAAAVLISAWSYFVFMRRNPASLSVAVAALAFFEFVLTFKQGTLLGAASFLLLLALPGSLSESVRENRELDVTRR